MIKLITAAIVIGIFYFLIYLLLKMIKNIFKK